jgi:ribosome-associated heat shock protein Hsp15
MTAPALEQRLDKWLWCARLVKTRALAVRLIAEGKVRINGIRAQKPSRLVHQGDVVTAMALGRLAVLRVIAVAERRGPPAAALSLYEDLTPEEAPPAHSGRAKPERERGSRPTKRDRRRLDAFRSGES